MNRRSIAMAFVAAAGLAAAGPSPARAWQVPSGPVTGPFMSPAMGAASNPYGTGSNPYFNPFLAPLLLPNAASGSTARTAGATLLFMGAARSGTGMLAREGATRARASRPAGDLSNPQAMPNRMWVPGASAAPYFHRGVFASQGSERRAYFMRHDSYYPNIAR